MPEPKPIRNYHVQVTCDGKLVWSRDCWAESHESAEAFVRREFESSAHHRPITVTAYWKE